MRRGIVREGIRDKLEMGMGQSIILSSLSPALFLFFVDDSWQYKAKDRYKEGEIACKAKPMTQNEGVLGS